VVSFIDADRLWLVLIALVEPSKGQKNKAAFAQTSSYSAAVKVISQNYYDYRVLFRRHNKQLY